MPILKNVTEQRLPVPQLPQVDVIDHGTHTLRRHIALGPGETLHITDKQAELFEDNTVFRVLPDPKEKTR